ncbi:MAG: SUMF1/EgtB/PvdO family nonheme iron enzyme, partial [Thermoguttaceae bacterium]
SWNETSGTVRQLTVDQEHNWCPTVLNNGRLLYQRWEYTDTPHAFYRLLFQCNPDGTVQQAYYGSNSFWPNAMFYARPIPKKVKDADGKFIAVVGGHHDNPRMGELILFDVTRGQHETSGVVQRVPGYGKKVEPIILDGLTQESWPKFLHPYPLSDKHFIVSCKPSPNSNWGIYLVDVFDNMTLITEEPGYALLEPIPYVAQERPPIIPDRIDLTRDDAEVFLADIYAGPGLAGVPRGEVKSLRVSSYNYSFRNIGGQVDRVGLDGPWDVRVILGTVPVEPDGSAFFRVPAYTPIMIQPLDENGEALQLMRSWFTAMPGETVSCVGCHETASTTPPAFNVTPSLSAGAVNTAHTSSVANSTHLNSSASANTGARMSGDVAALRRPISEIEPWYGPKRGFSYRREVQPVLDEYCISCHNSQTVTELQANNPGKFNYFYDLTDQPDTQAQSAGEYYDTQAKFPPSYLALKRYVRNPSIESEASMLPTKEYHADTTHLVKLLRQGHYGIKLDNEAWNRIITWIDFNTPAHGTWREITVQNSIGSDHSEKQNERRMLMKELYSNSGAYDAEEVMSMYTPVKCEPIASKKLLEMWQEKEKLVSQHEKQILDTVSKTTKVSDKEISLSDSVTLSLVELETVSNSNHNEGSLSEKERFLIGAHEVTNEQFALFNAEHDSFLERGDFLLFSLEDRGYMQDNPKQPVMRVSYDDAVRYCDWLTEKYGKKNGLKFQLPTETQWMCAASGGIDNIDKLKDETNDKHANFSRRENVVIHNFVPWSLPRDAVSPWRVGDSLSEDGFKVTAHVGSLAPNTFGIYDMFGNAAEWVSVKSKSNETVSGAMGGSWNDREDLVDIDTINFYPNWTAVFDTGFRVVAVPVSQQ